MTTTALNNDCDMILWVLMLRFGAAITAHHHHTAHLLEQGNAVAHVAAWGHASAAGEEEEGGEGRGRGGGAVQKCTGNNVHLVPLSVSMHWGRVASTWEWGLAD